MSRCGKGETWRGGTPDIGKVDQIIEDSMDSAGVAIMEDQRNRTQTCG